MEFTALPSQGAGLGQSSPDSKKETAEGFEEALEKALADSGLAVGLPGFIQNDIEVPTTDLDLSHSDRSVSERSSVEVESASPRIEQADSESLDWKPIRSEKAAPGSDQTGNQIQAAENVASSGHGSTSSAQGVGLGNSVQTPIQNLTSTEAPTSIDNVRSQGNAGPTKQAPMPANRELPDRILQIVTRMNQDGQKTHRAIMRLRPEKLGLMEIEIRLEDGRLSVRLAAQQAEAREMLESELERIRGVLSEQGFDEIAMHLESGRGGEDWSEQSKDSTGREWEHEEQELGEKPVRLWDGLIDLLA